MVRPHAKEHHLRVQRTARYYTLGTPSALVHDVWLVCHGYGQLAGRFIESFRCLEQTSRLIVAPEALSRFYLSTRLPHTAESKVGAIWMTRHDREAEIDDQAEYLDTLYAHVFNELARTGVERDRVRVTALGFSQGAAVVSRWVARGAAHVDRLILWGSGVPQDVNLRAVHERWPGLSLDVVYGTEDNWITPDAVRAQEVIYAAAGIPHQLHVFTGGHVLDDAVLSTLSSQ